jgi:hypothetical protein
MQHNYQTSSQITISVNTSRSMPLLTRLVKPLTGHATSPRVPARTQNLSPINLSQDDFWNMETANQEIALGTNHWKYQAFENTVVHPVTGREMEYMVLMKDPDLQPLWEISFGNEADHLFQGIGDIQGTNTCFFVELKNIPKDRQIKYGKIVCDNKPNKREKERVRLAVGDDRLDVATSTADNTTFKILINSTLSTKDARMMTMDINN